MELQFELLRAIILLFTNSGCSLDEAIVSLEYLRNDLIKFKLRHEGEN